MSTPSFEYLNVKGAERKHAFSKLWREWCFFLVVVRHFSIRLLIMTTALLGGATLFRVYGGGEVHTIWDGLFSTWRLIFGEQPEVFPDSVVLDVLCYVMPIVGLTVIIEGIIDFALVLRDRKRFERSWCKSMSNSMHNHVVLVGFGKLGYSTYLLLNKLGEQIVVIERDPNNQFLEELRREGVPLFIGDARREAILEDANLVNAKSIIVATNDDLANLEIALDARKIKPNIRVVLRMFDQNMADKVGDGFNIRVAMSQSALSAPAFAMSAVDTSIVHSFIVGDDLVVMQRWIVKEGGPLHGKTVGEVMQEYGVSIVKQRRNNDDVTLFPQINNQLEKDDSLLVQGPYDVLRRLTEYAAPASTTEDSFT